MSHATRDVEPRDRAAVRAIIRHAFERPGEANLVEQLRADGDVLFELVTAKDQGLTGHILYSPLSIDTDRGALAAAALAPVSVLPAFQRQGLGAALIQAGNARCRTLGLDAVLVLGHPSYYPRFGFSATAAEALQAPFTGPSFMALELKAGALAKAGRVRYARAFGV